jgi:Ca2+:H+ antiporter
MWAFILAIPVLLVGGVVVLRSSKALGPAYGVPAILSLAYACAALIVLLLTVVNSFQPFGHGSLFIATALSVVNVIVLYRSSRSIPLSSGCTAERHNSSIDGPSRPHQNPRDMRYLNLLGYAAIPLAYAVHLWLGRGHAWEPGATFTLAALGVIPLAHLMGEATEHLSAKAGPTWGGLLNATFGNAAELIIAIIALSKGLNEIVKASLTGSILGNLLLVAGASMVAGGWNRERQRFSKGAAEANAGLLLIGVAAMLVPAIFHFSAERMADAKINTHEHGVSVASSVVLLLIYVAGLIFTLRTHAHLFTRGPVAGRGAEDPSEAYTVPAAAPKAHGDEWSVRKSVIMLLVASVGIGFVAELLVASAELVAHGFGWNQVFVGVILLAIIGNAAEHSTALMLAMRDDMDTAMTITYQSSLQIALFATPLLVFVSAAMVKLEIGHATQYLNLVFTPLEVVAVALSVITVVILGRNGETNWFEGVLLLGLYAILGTAFFFLPEAAHAVGASTQPGGAH